MIIEGNTDCKDSKIIYTKWGVRLTPRGEYQFSLLVQRLIEYKDDPCDYRLSCLERAISVIRGE